MQTEAIYADRPEAATRFIRDGLVIGTVFQNWQGWVSAAWREWPNAAITDVHGSRDEAVAALFGAQS